MFVDPIAWTLLSLPVALVFLLYATPLARRGEWWYQGNFARDIIGAVTLGLALVGLYLVYLTEQRLSEQEGIDLAADAPITFAYQCDWQKGLLNVEARLNYAPRRPIARYELMLNPLVVDDQGSEVDVIIRGLRREPQPQKLNIEVGATKPVELRAALETAMPGFQEFLSKCTGCVVRRVTVSVTYFYVARRAEPERSRQSEAARPAC